MKIRKSSALLATGVVLALTAAACGGSSDNNGTTGGNSGGGNEPKGQMVYGEGTDKVVNFLPLISAGNSTATANVDARLFLSPFRTYPDFTIKPDLDLMASEPTSSTVGGKFTVVYKVNDKAVWGDGQPITADDFIFSWNMQKSSDPADGGCAALLGTTGYDQIESVTATDTKTATVTFKTPYADWKSLFGLYPKHVMDKGDAKSTCDGITKGWPTQDGIPTGAISGPWTLEKSNIDTQNSTETLTPNPKWWGAKTGLQRIVYQYIGNDAGVAVKNLKSNTVNMVYPQPQLDLIKQIQALSPQVTSEVNFGLSFEHMDFNLRNPNLAKKEVRQAIAYSLDRQAIVSGTVGQFDSRATVLNNRFYVNNQPEYKDNSGGEFGAPNVQKATQLLEAAGYKKGGDGIYALNGSRLSFNMITTVNNKLRENTIDLVASQAKAAGIEIKKDLDPDIFADKSKPKSLEAGGFDIALFAWVSSPYVSGNVSIYKSVKGDAQGQNYPHCNVPAVDTLMDQLTSETDSTKSADLANQADALLWDQMCTIPLYQKPTFIAFSATYTPYDAATGKGIGDNATNAGPLWNNDTFTLKQ